MAWFLDGLSLLILIFFGINGFSKGIIEEVGRLLGLIFSLISFTLSFELNKYFLLIDSSDTATITLLNSFEDLLIKSIWPLVTGSKEPG